MYENFLLYYSYAQPVYNIFYILGHIMFCHFQLWLPSSNLNLDLLMIFDQRKIKLADTI